MANQQDEEEKQPAKLPKEGESALTALRNLWGSTGRDRDFLDRVERRREAREVAVGRLQVVVLDAHAVEGDIDRALRQTADG